MNQGTSYEVFDPEKPTFVIKIGVAGLSRQRAEENMRQIMDNYGTTNANMWFLCEGETNDVDVKCVWGGKYNAFTNEEITKRLVYAMEHDVSIDIINDSKLTDEEKSKFTHIIRNHKLNSLLDE
jgi:hypothetical protein